MVWNTATTSLWTIWSTNSEAACQPSFSSVCYYYWGPHCSPFLLIITLWQSKKALETRYRSFTCWKWSYSHIFHGYVRSAGCIYDPFTHPSATPHGTRNPPTPLGCPCFDGCGTCSWAAGIPDWISDDGSLSSIAIRLFEWMMNQLNYFEWMNNEWMWMINQLNMFTYMMNDGSESHFSVRWEAIQ